MSFPNLPSSKGDIVIVDGQALNLRLLTELLSREGYTIRPIKDPEMALSSISFKPPELILLDIMMPKMDGYELCRSIKTDSRSAQIPIIFISASSDPDVKEQAFAVGGVDFIPKPFRQHDLLQRIHNALLSPKFS